MKWPSLLSALALFTLIPATLYAEEEAVSAEGDSKPAEDPWEHKINVDHPGFSDSAYVMEKDHAQVELGVGFLKPDGSDTRGDFSVLARFDIVDHVEARFEVPSLTFDPDGFDSFRADSFEAGAKVGGKLNDAIALAALPYVILPSSVPGRLDDVSFGLGLLADLYLTEGIDVTVSLYPRLMNYKQTDNQPGNSESGDLSFQLDGALVGSFHASQRLSFFVEGWFTYLTNTDALPYSVNKTFKPAADGGAVFYLTPSSALDLTVGARDLGDTNTVFGALGFSLRIL